jgi:integrase
VRDAADALVAGMRAGRIRTRSGDRYKPSTIAGYDAALRTRVLPALGERRLDRVTRRDLRLLVEDLLELGLDASSVRNALMPLRVLLRRAVEDGELAVNPAAGIALPAVRGRRDRIASPEEVRQLLAALPQPDRALWATAFYAGLRRGELVALRWQDVDLERRLLRVERAYDEKAHAFVEPKSRAGRRVVPIIAALATAFDEHRTSAGAGELVFASRRGEPACGSTLWRRARAAWGEAGFAPIGLHEARHTYASTLIAAGADAKTVATLMGHASVQTTYDLYGKLLPGAEERTGALLEAYLARSAARAPHQA